MGDKRQTEMVHGYEIMQTVVFENNRGIALAENPNAVQPYVTWMFTENADGKRDYEWGHYTSNKGKASADFDARVAKYMDDYDVSERKVQPVQETYKYYSTQRPVDIGTFPKTEGGPREIVNFDKREPVEHGRFMAWGYLEYSAPLTKKQMDDYELRPAIANPDRKRMEEQAQVVGKWEQAHRVPDVRRLAWWYLDFGVFVAKEVVTPEQLAERHNQVVAVKERAALKPIAEQLADAGRQIERGTDASIRKNDKSHEDR